MTLEERVAALETRLRSVEGVIYRRGGIGAAVKRLVEQWPGRRAPQIVAVLRP